MKLIIIITAFILFSTLTLAQLELTSELYRYSDDNIYNSAYKISDNIYNGSLNASYYVVTENNTLQFYNQNSVNYYQEYIATSSLFRKYGVADNLRISEKSQFNFGVNYGVKNNRDVFTILNFSQLSAYGNYRYSFAESDFITAGYVYNNNTFNNFSLFSHSVHKTFIRVNSSFVTETSLILGADISAKLYSENEPSAANQSYQLTLFGQVGQAIGEKAGLSGYFQLRRNLSQAARSFYYDNTLFYQDELFNDVFSSEGYETGLSLTKLFSKSFGAKAELTFSRREYNALPVMDTEGNVLASSRIDNQIGFGVEMQNDLSNYLPGLTLQFNWNYLINSSNDVFYKYNNQLFSVGLDLSF